MSLRRSPIHSTNRIRTIVSLTSVFLFILAIVANVSAANDTRLPGQTVGSCTTPVRIMPLGDSITQGSSSGPTDPTMWISYRYDLWHSLQQGGY